MGSVRGIPLLLALFAIGGSLAQAGDAYLEQCNCVSEAETYSPPTLTSLEEIQSDLKANPLSALPSPMERFERAKRIDPFVVKCQPGIPVKLKTVAEVRRSPELLEEFRKTKKYPCHAPEMSNRQDDGEEIKYDGVQKFVRDNSVIQRWNQNLQEAARSSKSKHKIKAQP